MREWVQAFIEQAEAVDAFYVKKFEDLAKQFIALQAQFMRKLELDETQEQEKIQKKNKNKENSFIEVSPTSKTGKRYVSPIDGQVLNSNNMEMDNNFQDSAFDEALEQSQSKNRQSYLVKE